VDSRFDSSSRDVLLRVACLTFTAPAVHAFFLFPPQVHLQIIIFPHPRNIRNASVTVFFTHSCVLHLFSFFQHLTSTVSHCLDNSLFPFRRELCNARFSFLLFFSSKEKMFSTCTFLPLTPFSAFDFHIDQCPLSIRVEENNPYKVQLPPFLAHFPFLFDGCPLPCPLSLPFHRRYFLLESSC